MPLPELNGAVKAKRRGRPNVALLIETSNAYARGLLRGIRAYIREHRSWSIYVGEQRRAERAPLWLKKWHGDGIIARIESAAIAQAVLASGLSAVDVSAARYVPQLLYVETDDAAIAGLAAEHLLQRGFRHYGYCGDPRFNWSNWREEHFQRLIAEAGFDCHVYRPSSRRRGTATWEQERAGMAAWIRHLPKPVGVMACYDIRGREVLDVCRQLGVSVPDEVAVIGVDNDELLCDLADPPLSSVIPDTYRTGYEAARLLDLVMAGQTELPTAHLIKPLGIVTRDSTDVLATDDSDLSAAVRFIRAHATNGIKVEDVLTGDHSGPSRTRQGAPCRDRLVARRHRPPRWLPARGIHERGLQKGNGTAAERLSCCPPQETLMDRKARLAPNGCPTRGRYHGGVASGPAAKLAAISAADRALS